MFVDTKSFLRDPFTTITRTEVPKNRSSEAAAHVSSFGALLRRVECQTDLPFSGPPAHIERVPSAEAAHVME